MNSGLTNAALAPARPVWRFEPSPASEAIWANDLLIQRIYECLIGEYEEDVDPVTRRDLINWMVLSKDRFVFFANLFWYGAAPEELLTAQKIGCSLVSVQRDDPRVRADRTDQLQPRRNDTTHTAVLFVCYISIRPRTICNTRSLHQSCGTGRVDCLILLRSGSLERPGSSEKYQMWRSGSW